MKYLNPKKDQNGLNLDLCSLMSKDKFESQFKNKVNNPAPSSPTVDYTDANAVHIYKKGATIVGSDEGYVNHADTLLNDTK